MFKRKKSQSRLQKLGEMLWPSMGWRRMARYWRHRVVRLPDSTGSIAAGLAIGAGVSFTPFVGTHFIQSGVLAYVFRINVTSSLIGTFVGNPWTFPFMWWAAMSLGAFLLSFFGVNASYTVPPHADLGVLWNLLLEEPLRVFLPWFIGGYLMALMSWPLFYGVFYVLLKSARFAKTKARLHTVHKIAKEVTGQKK